VKLIRRRISLELLVLSGCLLALLVLNGAVRGWSHIFRIITYVRHNSVWSLILFAIYTDDIGSFLNGRRNIFVVLDADDILLLSPWVTALQK